MPSTSVVQTEFLIALGSEEHFVVFFETFLSSLCLLMPHRPTGTYAGAIRECRGSVGCVCLNDVQVGVMCHNNVHTNARSQGFQEEHHIVTAKSVSSSVTLISVC